MNIKKEIDIILVVIILIIFLILGSYIGLKDQKKEKVVDSDLIWSITEGSKERFPKIEPKPPIEETPAEIVEDEFRIIEIKDTKFDPKELEIAVGTTVHWVNQDSKRKYQVYEKSDNQKFNSGQLNQFQSYEYTFNDPGTYYFNDAVFTFMTGKIIVK